MAADKELPKIPSFKPTGKKEDRKAGFGALSKIGKTTNPATQGSKTGRLKFPGFGLGKTSPSVGLPVTMVKTTIQ